MPPGSGKGGGGPCNKCGHICGNAGSLARHQNACNGPTTGPEEPTQEDPQVEVGQLVIKRMPKELTANEQAMIPQAVIEITTLLQREGQPREKLVFLTEEISIVLNHSKGPRSDGARAIEFTMAVKRGQVVGESHPYKASTAAASLAATVSSALESILMNEKPWERPDTASGARVLAVDGNNVRVSAEFSMEDFGVYWKTIPRLHPAEEDIEEDADEAAVTTLLATPVPTEVDFIAQADAHLASLEQETAANRQQHMRQRRAELDSQIPEPVNGDVEAEDVAAGKIVANWKTARVEAWEKFPSSTEAAELNTALAEYKARLEAAREAQEAVAKLLPTASQTLAPPTRVPSPAAGAIGAVGKRRRTST